MTKERTGWRWAAATALASAVFMGACGIAGGIGGPDQATMQAMHARAGKVLDAWGAAVSKAGGSPTVVPVGELTGQIGDWEEALGSDGKIALMAGMVMTENELSATAPATADVTWSDGTTVSVPVIGAQAAIAAIEQSADPGGRASCGACSPLIATAGTLVTAAIMTSRGPATGPVWEFTIRGTAVKVTRVAVADAVTVASMADNPGGAVGIDAASGSVSGTSVTVSFTGAPDPASQPCGEDYTAEAVESDLALTVIVYRHPNLTPGLCTLVGARRTATATLTRALGDRPVLDLASGQPVTLSLTP
jgi:hypothetical protein